MSHRASFCVLRRKTLEVELCDFSQAENETIAWKADQFYKLTAIFTQNDIQGLF